MRNGLRALLLSIPCLFALAGAMYAADDISVKSDFDKAFLTIGDQLHYEVTVTYSPDIQVFSQFPAPEPDILEVKKIEDINRKEKKHLVTGRRFTLVTYKLGDFVIDPVTIRYRLKDGTEKTIQTNKLYLTVKSVAEGLPKDDIRDVKGVVPLTVKIMRVVIPSTVLLVLLASLLLWKKFAAKKGKAAEPEILLTPEEEALNRLRELFESDLLKRGFVKMYYLRLSEILRLYFERRYKILAVELTTTETLRALRPLNLPPTLFQKIQYVLGAADLAKFAKWVPPPPEVLTLNKRSEEIVQESAPQAAPAPVPANGSSEAQQPTTTGEAPSGV